MGLSIINFLIIGLFVKGYFPSYMKEKGKNAATKEDIEDITQIIESIKQSNAKDIEQLKSNLSNEDKILEKRREVYEDIVESLRLFISGHSANDKQKNHFYSAYSKAWLWAPDAVLNALNHFLDAQVSIANNFGSIDQTTAKALYEKVIIEMRKDVGFENTTENKYRFVAFR